MLVLLQRAAAFLLGAGSLVCSWLHGRLFEALLFVISLSSSSIDSSPGFRASTFSFAAFSSSLASFTLKTKSFDLLAILNVSLLLQLNGLIIFESKFALL